MTEEEPKPKKKRRPLSKDEKAQLLSKLKHKYGTKKMPMHVIEAAIEKEEEQIYKAGKTKRNRLKRERKALLKIKKKSRSANRRKK